MWESMGGRHYTVEHGQSTCKALGPTRWVIGFVMQHEVLIPSWLVMEVLT